jgi:UDP-2,4-diacetamido-2,4,6-trideoxy-beta-L-altropyranose hydrolase
MSRTVDQTVSQTVIAVRVDAGPGIGLGHLQRSLALAQVLRGHGAAVTFILPGDPSACEMVANAAFPLCVVEPGEAVRLDETRSVVRRLGAAAVVLDSYGFGGDALRPPVAPVTVVIDDCGDRDLPVDLIINGSLAAQRFAYSTRGQPILLLGAAYALLRPEFASLPPRRNLPEVQRVLVTVGGADPHDLTPRLTHWVRAALPGAAIDVVVGSFFDFGRFQSSTRTIDDPNVSVHVKPKSMRDLMLHADLAVTGGGQTTYELAATGTSALAICLATNQSLSLEALAAAGTLEVVGEALAPDLETRVRRAVAQLSRDAAKRSRMSVKGRELVDGNGVHRAAAAILGRLAGVHA